MNAIEVAHLFFNYGGPAVLEDVSFSLGLHEFVAIFGPNGGGKTTLLQLLMGFLKPISGSIAVLGKSPKGARLQIGWVPQTFHFDRSFPISVKEVVLEGRLHYMKWNGAFHKRDHEIAEEALERVGLQKTSPLAFAFLSGGQMQRVLIARALASKPQLLLLDEPTANIDPEGQQEMYELLAELKKEMAILMVTHHLHQAVRQADRLFCVQKRLSILSAEKVCEHYALGLYHLSSEES
jgi:zinc transport system ATP-binding protein